MQRQKVHKDAYRAHKTGTRWHQYGRLRLELGMAHSGLSIALQPGNVPMNEHDEVKGMAREPRSAGAEEGGGKDTPRGLQQNVTCPSPFCSAPIVNSSFI